MLRTHLFHALQRPHLSLFIFSISCFAFHFSSSSFVVFVTAQIIRLTGPPSTPLPGEHRNNSPQQQVDSQLPIFSFSNRSEPRCSQRNHESRIFCRRWCLCLINFADLSQVKKKLNSTFWNAFWRSPRHGASRRVVCVLWVLLISVFTGMDSTESRWWYSNPHILQILTYFAAVWWHSHPAFDKYLRLRNNFEHFQYYCLNEVGLTDLRFFFCFS